MTTRKKCRQPRPSSIASPSSLQRCHDVRVRAWHILLLLHSESMDKVLNYLPIAHNGLYFG